MKIPHLKKLDALLASILFVSGVLFSYLGSGLVSEHVVENNNIWFQGDVNRVFENMTDRYSDHYRTKVHPIFSLATNPAVKVLRVAGFSKIESVKIFTSFIAGLWLVAIFLVLRLIRLNREDAVLFTLLAAVSSSAVFWSTVPETYLLGSLSMLCVMCVVSINYYVKLHSNWYIGASAFSLSMTITNWMAGIYATLVDKPLKKFFRITFDALLVVILLWLVQFYLYPSAEFFLWSREEEEYLLAEAAGGYVEKIISFFIHSMIMPTFQFLENPYALEFPIVSVQFAKIGSTGLLGWSATFMWIILLLYGIWSALRYFEFKNFSIVLSLIVFSQLILHLLYGDETFLYSSHWLPLLVMFAAIGAISPYRKLVLGIVSVLIILVGANNYNQFNAITNALNSGKYGLKNNERSKLLFEIANSSADWPRSRGHVLLANPGSLLNLKGYHEPGGSFSPGFGSLGISFVFFNEDGKLEFSSNSIPIDEIKQKLSLNENSISTETTQYSSTWQVSGHNRWSLKFKPKKTKDLTAALRVTSSGPSGAPIRKFVRNENELIVNDKYKIIFKRKPINILFNDERKVPNLLNNQNINFWEPPDGFGSALALIDESVEYFVEVEVLGEANTYYVEAQSENLLKINVPDKNFINSLEAQIFHLKSGFINNETRPGDPGHYDVNWLRDGAYVIAALARAGELDTAKHLAEDFAKKDFFGGFGAEADAPGLAIWALHEVSSRLNDEDYDNWIWPHVLRKTNLITEMLYAKTKIYKEFSEPVVPDLRNKKYIELMRIAFPEENGLIQGKMDNQKPIFYVNATAYLGLTRAVDIAERLGYSDKAKEFQKTAQYLKTNWEKEIQTHNDRNNVRTRIVGLWPSQIAVDKKELYEGLLESNWRQLRDEEGNFIKFPKWTYFDIGEAHQWLFLEKPQRAWATLNWFWKHQASPGLYSWWEGKGEENSYQLWENVRGWHTPPHITPHYWSAAEMALLQFNMLAYEELDEGRYTVVIGAGIPNQWLKNSLSVQGLSLQKGELDWAWDGERLFLNWSGNDNAKFILGPEFPASATIKILKEDIADKSTLH